MYWQYTWMPCYILIYDDIILLVVLFVCVLYLCFDMLWILVHYLIVATVEEVLSEAVRDCGAHSQDFGHVFPTDHHVPIVQLNIHIWLLI